MASLVLFLLPWLQRRSEQHSENASQVQASISFLYDNLIEPPSSEFAINKTATWFSPSFHMVISLSVLHLAGYAIFFAPPLNTPLNLLSVTRHDISSELSEAQCFL
ncbi:hypothetical protein LSTR_LSTR002854 [Laodelphax striatellus]|uniref:Uncharacterized protein n=1 Tax=Laodelphax striatellus TaxID=195883 RepID=A0A482WZU9_LAOST|nr:hypothetical protein LSTR_LSTR017372 [Laodelphax striatellus]RZF45411.1 hypothetical protein LSTR_LSTR002854 [Laodelphax striatellus]